MTVVGEADNADAARAAVAAHAPDVVFLDIEMPAERGTDLAASLPEPRPFIVFATAYERFAVDAFQYDAADYLLKPVNRQRLQATLARLRAQARRAAATPSASWPPPRAPRRTCCRRRCPSCPATRWAPRTLPARGVGGDFYDAALVGDRLAFVLGDVVGQGHGGRPHRLERAGAVAGGHAASAT